MNSPAILNFPAFDPDDLPAAISLMSHAVGGFDAPGQQFGGMYLAMAITDGDVGTYDGIPPQVFPNLAGEDVYFNPLGSNGIRDPKWEVGPDGYLWLVVCDGTDQSNTIHIYKSLSLSDAPVHIVDLTPSDSSAFGNAHWVNDGTNMYVLAEAQQRTTPSDAAAPGHIWTMPAYSDGSFASDPTVAANWTHTALTVEEPWATGFLSNGYAFWDGTNYWVWTGGSGSPGDLNPNAAAFYKSTSSLFSGYTKFSTPGVPAGWIYPNLVFQLGLFSQPVLMSESVLRFYSSAQSDENSVPVPAYCDVTDWNTVAIAMAQFNGGETLTGSDAGFASGNSPWTVLIWFRTNQAASTQSVPFNYGTAGDVFFEIGGDTFLSINGGGAEVESTSPVQDGALHTAVAAYDGTNLYLYLDGALVGSTPASVSITLGQVMLGNYLGGGNYYTGSMANVGVWNAQGVNSGASNYDATLDPIAMTTSSTPASYIDGNCVSFWPLAADADDTSGNSNNLTSNGGTVTFGTTGGAAFGPIVCCAPQGMAGTIGIQPEYCTVTRITDSGVIARLLSSDNLTALASAKLAAWGTPASVQEACAAAIAAAFPNAPQVDLVNAPNATAVTAIQSGLATASAQASISSALASISSTLSSSPIEVASPVSASGVLNLVMADDYLYADGRAIQFGLPSGGSIDYSTANTLSLDICTMLGGVPTGDVVVSITGSYATGSFTINAQNFTAALRFQPTAADTALLTNWQPKAYAYRVRALWNSPEDTITVVLPTPLSATW